MQDESLPPNEIDQHLKQLINNVFERHTSAVTAKERLGVEMDKLQLSITELVNTIDYYEDVGMLKYLAKKLLIEGFKLY